MSEMDVNYDMSDLNRIANALERIVELIEQSKEEAENDE